MSTRAGHTSARTRKTVEKTHSWWQVMCLTGVDYFSTLGYQPAIAALAAGCSRRSRRSCSWLLTLLGALPVYRRVAAESPRGSGSIAHAGAPAAVVGGQALRARAARVRGDGLHDHDHPLGGGCHRPRDREPFRPGWLHGNQVLVTLVLIALLGAVFLRGFKEAIGIAVVLVAVYLALNLVVVVVAIGHVAEHATLVTDWWGALNTQHGNPLIMVGIALLVFPKLALGLSGFETGVAVMPQIKGGPATTRTRTRPGRIRGANRLLTTAALIMSGFLITLEHRHDAAHPAEGVPAGRRGQRPRAGLPRSRIPGTAFGTVYDISTICILWFAGASAMAGLLNLVPRYLPRYGMAPQWARAVRPLVLVFTAIAFLITIVFDANVDAQGGAYATGVLVLITSASVAVALSARRKQPALAHHRVRPDLA